jgi:hypothetical protein
MATVRTLINISLKEVEMMGIGIKIDNIYTYIVGWLAFSPSILSLSVFFFFFSSFSSSENQTRRLPQW